jgi:restriction system protein
MVPDFQTLMLPVLRRLGERRWRTTDLVASVAEEFKLSAEDVSELLPSGRQTRLANRVHWALAYLNKSGLILRVGRGEYDISDAGRSVLAAPPDRITLDFLVRNFPGARAFRRASDAEDNGRSVEHATVAPLVAVSASSTPDDAIDSALASIEEKVRQDLLDRLLEAPPAFFERVVVDLLLAMGYGSTAEDAGRSLGGSGDGGVDGVIREDRLGLDLIYIQAKRYRDTPVTVDQLRSFAGALDDRGARKGVFITTSRFTADAQNFAERQQMKRIALVDGEKLTDLMLRHDVGVRPARTIVVKKLDVDYFEPDDSA